MHTAANYNERTGEGVSAPSPALTTTQPQEGFAMADSTQSPNPSARKPLTAERLREVLHYDPETGIFTWKVSLAPRGPVGAVAGCSRSGRRQYVVIRIDGELFLAQRLAWLYMTDIWPTDKVDHKDNDASNNRWSNLREATNAQNCFNQGKRSVNSSGFKGVTLFKRDRVWTAQITVSGKNHYLGRFQTPEEAHAAYCEAAERLHGEFARVA